MAGPFLFGQANNQVNLLTNSGFGVWSNSEDLYVAVTSGGSTAGDVPCSANVCVGRGLAFNNCCTTPTGDTEADATTGWTNLTFGTFIDNLLKFLKKVVSGSIV